MKSVFRSILVSFCFLYCLATNGQDLFIQSLFKSQNDFSDCAAIFYKDTMLAEKFERGKEFVLDQGMTGKLSVSAIRFSGCNSAEAVKKIPFKIAIKDSKSHTIWMFSDDTFYEVELKNILKRCNHDDKIIFMTVDKKYSLSQNEIVVFMGC